VNDLMRSGFCVAAMTLASTGSTSAAKDWAKPSRPIQKKPCSSGRIGAVRRPGDYRSTIEVSAKHRRSLCAARASRVTAMSSSSDARIPRSFSSCVLSPHNSLQYVFVDLQPGRGDIFFEVIDARSPWDREYDGRSGQQPCQGHL